MEAEAAKLIGAGLAAIGMIGAGIGVGNVWASYITALARIQLQKAKLAPTSGLASRLQKLSRFSL